MPVPLHIFPLFVSILTPLCCFVPYLLAVHYGHVSSFLPYISDAGGNVPEGSLFSQLIDVVAVMFAITVYIRYKQISYHYFQQSKENQSTQYNKEKQLNKLSLVIGMLMPIGAVVIGNYRMPEILGIHLFGAFIAFTSANTYLMIQTWISFRLSLKLNSLTIAKTRLIITIAAIILYLTTIITSAISIYLFGKFPENDIRFHWSSDLPGYTWHIISAITEWLFVFMASPFFITFINEFKSLKWSEITLKSHQGERLNMTTDSNRNVNV